MICWKCKEKIGMALCISCGCIQPPPSKLDFFVLLGLERQYFVKKNDIEIAYRRLSKKIHPDRFRSKTAVERRMSLQWTALVNEGRRVLLDPILRARYLATGKAQPKERGMTVAQEFLERIFELQMQAMNDPKSAQLQAKELQEENTERMQEIFRAWESGQGTLQEIEEHLGRWKYLTNILERGEG